MRTSASIFNAADFVTIARATHIHGAWADSRVSLEKELAGALTQKQSALIACRISRKSYDGTF
jgi:acetolactate synthase-1/2/3 large subunit